MNKFIVAGGEQHPCHPLNWPSASLTSPFNLISAFSALYRFHIIKRRNEREIFNRSYVQFVICIENFFLVSPFVKNATATFFRTMQTRLNQIRQANTVFFAFLYKKFRIQNLSFSSHIAFLKTCLLDGLRSNFVKFWLYSNNAWILRKHFCSF